jgi:hypothetical protein
VSGNGNGGKAKGVKARVSNHLSIEGRRIGLERKGRGSFGSQRDL